MMSAIVLAAGESKRMGTLKQLLPFGEGTMLETVLDTLLRSRVDEIVVVLGHRWEEVAAVVHRKMPQASHAHVRIALNERYQDEMLSSVQCGVRALSAEADAFLVALGDQPLITPHLVNRLIEVFIRERPPIVIPTYHGKRGHPVLFDAALRSEILALGRNATLKEVVERHADAVRELPCEEEGIVRDVDHPSEYWQALEALGKD
ncbi:MAG: nucleotidyltransferase family protein [Abditibacteriales bacterium]|nr:nucleotidyltransferase family protein [Abditibacteriales bacterium]MDW8367686.1 nucleotidyltransferase family protein [Abditibacteriales bacterium]